MSDTQVVGEQAAGDAIVQHPYYPRDYPIPHYLASKLDVYGAFVVLGSGIAVMATIAAIMIKRSRVPLTFKDKFVVMWMLTCTGIHMVLEGYFSINHKNLAGMDTVLADLWREYSHSDSRYLTSDPFTVIMEGITAFFDGPMAAATAVSVVTDCPFRYIAQLLTSVAQVYGNIIYMLTNHMEGYKYTNPDPYYVYFYFMFMNGIWMVFGSYFAYDACVHLYRGMLIAKRATTVKKSK